MKYWERAMRMTSPVSASKLRQAFVVVVGKPCTSTCQEMQRDGYATNVESNLKTNVKRKSRGAGHMYGSRNLHIKTQAQQIHARSKNDTRIKQIVLSSISTYNSQAFSVGWEVGT